MTQWRKREEIGEIKNKTRREEERFGGKNEGKQRMMEGRKGGLEVWRKNWRDELLEGMKEAWRHGGNGGKKLKN